jgi:hypothetical protein
MLDACCSEAEISSLAGIKTCQFTVPGNIINLLYGPFRKIKEVKKFLISSSIQKPVSSPAVAGLSTSNHCRFQKLGSKFTILAYEDT